MLFTSPALLALLLPFAAHAQVYTTTLPYVDGDTVVVSATENAAGATLIQTLSIVTGPAVATTTPLVPTTTALTTPLLTTTTPLGSTTTTTPLLVPTTTTTRPLLPTTTPTTIQGAQTTERVVGGTDTSIRTTARTTFVYVTDGVTSTAIFTPSFAPTLQPPTPSSGSVLKYDDYTSQIAPALISQASAAQAAASGGSSSGGERRMAIGGAMGLFVGGLVAVLGGVVVLL